jgi:hypothetical protein
MPGNLYVPQTALTFNPIVPVQFQQALGAAGWIADVDLSGSLPAACAGKYCLFICSANLAAGTVQNSGIRDVASSDDTKYAYVGNINYGGVPFIAKVSAARTVDLYREAALNYFDMLGYFS